MKTLTQSQGQKMITAGQLKQLTRMIADIAESEPVQTALQKLSAKSVERLKGNAEFTESLRRFAVERIVELSVVNDFANEEVASRYGYLSGYTKPNGLTEQCNRLRELFSGLGYANQELTVKIEHSEIPLPANAEGWFAIPNWAKNPKIFGSTYSEAVQKVLDAIKVARGGKFSNYREGQITEKQLRQSARSIKFWQDLSEAQGNPDILLVPAQFGLRHRGRSVRCARVIMEDTPGEFGLGAFAIGCMLLTNPIRLQHCDDLWIDCAGDEFDDPVSDVRFVLAPYFGFGGGEVKFGAVGVGRAGPVAGSASAFLPQ